MADSIGNSAGLGLLSRREFRLRGMRAAIVPTVLLLAAVSMAWIVSSIDDSRTLLACLATSVALLACASILTGLWGAAPVQRPAFVAEAVASLSVGLLAPVTLLDNWDHLELTLAILVAVAGASTWIAWASSGDRSVRLNSLNLGAVLGVGVCLAVWVLRSTDTVTSVDSAAGPLAVAALAPLFGAGASSRQPLGIALGVGSASIVLLALAVMPDHSLILAIAGICMVGGLIAVRHNSTEAVSHLDLIAERHGSWLPLAALLALAVLIVGLDGFWRWMAVASFATVAAATTSALTVDLVVRQRLLDQLAHLVRFTASQARLDPLTRLPNRAALDARLNEEVERATRYRHPTAILFVDVDHFKSINDAQGHEAGDRALRLIGDTIRSTIRTPDFVARFGGEEFVVIAPGTWSIDATVLGHRIQEAIGGSVRHDNGRPVTVSIGIAGVPEHAGTPDDVLWIADQALYRAKHAGRNRVEIAIAPVDQDLRDNS